MDKSKTRICEKVIIKIVKESLLYRLLRCLLKKMAVMWQE
jgi:hypothetical protein